MLLLRKLQAMLLKKELNNQPYFLFSVPGTWTAVIFPDGEYKRITEVEYETDAPELHHRLEEFRAAQKFENGVIVAMSTEERDNAIAIYNANNPDQSWADLLVEEATYSPEPDAATFTID